MSPVSAWQHCVLSALKCVNNFLPEERTEIEDMLRQSWTQMCDHLDAKHNGLTETQWLRELPLPTIVANVRSTLVPHADALLHGGAELDAAWDAALPSMHPAMREVCEAVRGDERMRRFALLFVELCTATIL